MRKQGELRDLKVRRDELLGMDLGTEVAPDSKVCVDLLALLLVAYGTKQNMLTLT